MCDNNTFLFYVSIMTMILHEYSMMTPSLYECACVRACVRACVFACNPPSNSAVCVTSADIMVKVKALTTQKQQYYAYVCMSIYIYNMHIINHYQREKCKFWVQRMVMIMKLTMMACNDHEKLCSHIMIIIHFFFT